jgi:upstream activation factor subunit UAF30
MASVKAVPRTSVASVCAMNGALTLVLLDGALANEWQPLLDEPEDDDLGGHPQKVVELLEADAKFTSGTLKVGAGRALVLSLEGISGEAEVYRLPDGALVLAEPSRAWWNEDDNFGKNAGGVESMFAEALEAPPEDARQVSTVAVPSGKLLVFDASSDLTRANKSLKKSLAVGDVKRFGLDGDGLVLALEPGAIAVRRRVFSPRWAKRQQLVVVYLTPPRKKRARKSAPAKPRKAAAAKRAPAKIPSAAGKLCTPTPALAAIIGRSPLRRTEVTKKVWAYILSHKLLPRGKTLIIADAALKKIVGKDQISMFDLPKIINAHLR